MKLELFTEEDAREISNRMDSSHTYIDVAGFLNAFLEEKFEHGSTQDLRKEGLTIKWGGVSPNGCQGDTHHIWYITKPIEVEKVECKHKLSGQHNHHVDALNNIRVAVNITEPKIIRHDHCQECGEKL